MSRLDPPTSCVLLVTVSVMDDVILATPVSEVLSVHSLNTESASLPSSKSLDSSNKFSRNRPEFTTE